MLDPVLALARVALAESQVRLETAARNIAHTTTPGYRREVFSLDRGVDGSLLRQSAVDLGQGALRATGEATDLAISGPGFFVVEHEGRELLTRSGQFVRSADGYLVGAGGQVLLGEGGAPIEVATADFQVALDGTVLEGGLPVGRIAVVVPEDGDSWAASGGGLYFQASAMSPLERDQVSVRQGMLESSNVVSSNEMLSVMLALRTSEVGARLVQTYDGLLGQAITTLGRGSR